MDAALGRFDVIFNNNLFFLVVDGLIALGMVRDWIVDGRVRKVYPYALPGMIVLQSFAIYTWRMNPAWWAAVAAASSARKVTGLGSRRQRGRRIKPCPIKLTKSSW
jgi:hypothetical protein